MIDKGIISSFETDTDRNGDILKARVLPVSSQSMPTRPLIIPWHLRGDMGNLQVGDEVFFALADDLSGIILERADGEWSGIIPGDVTIKGDQTTNGKIKTTDVQTASVSSLDTHIHGNGNQGKDTTPPKN